MPQPSNDIPSASTPRLAAIAIASAVLWISVTAIVIRLLAHLGVWDTAHGLPGLVVGFLASALAFMIAATMSERFVGVAQWGTIMNTLILAAAVPMAISLLLPQVRFGHRWTVLGVLASCVFAFAMVRLRMSMRQVAPSESERRP